MTEWASMNWRHWPKPMQLSASLFGGALALAVVYMVLAGTPKPVLPSSALFEPVSIEQTLASSRPELSSFDFIFRPVFALTRKPPVQPDLPTAEEAAAVAALEADAVVVESIDGVNLLGIFGSGEVAGVIIRLDNGERQRLVVGESVKGWTLESVGSRHALFQAATGEEARLEMIFAANQSPAAPVIGNEADVGRQRVTVDANPVGQMVEGPMQSKQPASATPRITFENYYGGARKRDAASGQKGTE